MRIRHFWALSPRLVTLLLVIFSLLVISPLIIVLTVSHYQSEKIIRGHLDAALERTREHTNRALHVFFDNLLDSTTVLADTLAINPASARDPRYNDILQHIFVNLNHILNIIITFEDGFSRAFARVTPDLRAQHPEIPVDAQWAAATTTQLPSASPEPLEEVFYGDYPEIISTLKPVLSPNFLKSVTYIGAKSARSVFFSEVHPGMVSQLPVVGVAIPIQRHGAFHGVVTANVAVNDFSEFLSKTRVSKNSQSIILNTHGDVVVASSLSDQTDPLARAKALSRLAQRAAGIDSILRESGRDQDMHNVILSLDGEDHSVLNFKIQNELALNYRALIITPLADFVGDLEQNSRNFSLIISALLLLEALLIFQIARRLSRRINNLSELVARIRNMSFEEREGDIPSPCPVREVEDLQHGISLLRNALRSFSLYVPLGVVRRLVSEGKAIAPGVESRELTILFCDLESFSSLAQTIPAEELLDYMTEYFSIATQAVVRNGGTVDKFIGDAVMAFWGAPEHVNDHAVSACRAALEIVRDLEEANQRRQTAGKRTLHVRVGINSAPVLVGNIGSPDRLSYTALGDGVNVASRLEGKNKELGCSICISDTTYELAKSNLVVRPLSPISVKGRTGEFMVYELIDTMSAKESRPEAVHA